MTDFGAQNFEQANNVNTNNFPEGTVTIEDALNDVERSYYQGLFQYIQNDGQFVYGRSLTDFLLKSELDEDSLAYLWRQCATSQSTRLSRLEFFRIMRGIAMTQNDVEDFDQEVFYLAINFPFTPRFKGIPQARSPYNDGLGRLPPLDMLYPEITPRELDMYESFIDQVSYTPPFSFQRR